MTSRLELYNNALKALGSRKLSSLTENREPRYLLDDVWGDGGVTSGVVKHCLEQGLWTFAIRSAAITYDPDFTPAFGYRYRFAIPADFIRTASVCDDEYFNNPLLRMLEEGGYWYSDLQTIFVKYVSNDSAYGLDLTVWPESFCRFVELTMASRTVSKLTSSGAREAKINDDLKKARMQARCYSAMEQPTKFPPQGLFVRSRFGPTSRGRDIRRG